MNSFFPDLIIGGAPKSGTTSVCSWLAEHPSATCSSKKEIFFLMDPDDWMINEYSNIHKTGLDSYRECFPKIIPDENICFEGTTTYIYQKTALDSVKKHPDTKVLFILRKPSERVYSNFKYFYKSKGDDYGDTSFSEYLDEVIAGRDFNGNQQLSRSIEHSKYERFVDEWLNSGADIKIWIFEELIDSPQLHMKDLCEWLEIDPTFFNEYQFFPDNRTVEINNKRLHKLFNSFGKLIPDSGVRKRLKGLYHRVNTKEVSGKTLQDIKALEALDKELDFTKVYIESVLGREIKKWS